MPLFSGNKKDKEGKKKKKKTTTTDTTKKKKKRKSKDKHGKHHNKGSKGTKDSYGGRKHGDKGEEEPKKKKKRKPRIPQLPPCEGEELRGVVLVKDRNKRSSGTNEPLFPSREWKPSATPALAYRSVENVEPRPSDAIPAILGGHKKVVPERKKSSPGQAAGDGRHRVQDRSKRQKRTSPAKKEAEPDKEKGNERKAEDKSVVVEDEKKAKEVVVPASSPPQRNNKKRDSRSDKDLTKKEERSDKDRQRSREEDLRKWRSYADKVLNGGMSGIAKEFRQVKGHLPTAATRTAYDEHPEDNRFEDIVCVDHSRVEIKDDDAYIHANWVEIEKTKKMILTQLPLPHTASRFWQMVLETDAQAILLLLTTYEYDTFQAEATFPGQQDFLHFKDKHIRVGEFKRVKVAPGWTMRVLSITNGDKKKYLHLHHYNHWYHGQELKSYKDLLSIGSVFQKYKGPHVVMSLSGCGRAGTYAAFEMTHSRLHSSTVEKVSVADAVQRVRDGRMHAVQRASQLKTIHLAILDHVLNNGFIKDLSSKQKETWEEIQKTVDE